MMHSRDRRAVGWRRRVAVAVALLSTACAASGCDEAGEGSALAAAPECSARVIVRFAAVPDATAFADIERANALELVPLDAITADTRVFLLRTAGSAADCRAASARLESDERVRYVDLDLRRAPHDAQPTPKEETL